MVTRTGQNVALFVLHLFVYLCRLHTVTEFWVFIVSSAFCILTFRHCKVANLTKDTLVFPAWVPLCDMRIWRYNIFCNILYLKGQYILQYPVSEGTIYSAISCIWRYNIFCNILYLKVQYSLQYPVSEGTIYSAISCIYFFQYAPVLMFWWPTTRLTCATATYMQLNFPVL